VPRTTSDAIAATLTAAGVPLTARQVSQQLSAEGWAADRNTVATLLCRMVRLGEVAPVPARGNSVLSTERTAYTIVRVPAAELDRVLVRQVLGWLRATYPDALHAELERLPR
jgi:hypothetical protein